jgi:hypothetical protein
MRQAHAIEELGSSNMEAIDNKKGQRSNQDTEEVC